MQSGIEFASAELERAMRDVAQESDRADREVLTMNAVGLLKSVVYNTPKDTGTTRAGWWPAWNALELSGAPGTGRKLRSWTRKGGREYVPEGDVNDNRDNKEELSFEFWNRTHYITKRGKKVYYPYVLNGRTGWMDDAASEATFKFERIHEKLLRKHSKI